MICLSHSRNFLMLSLLVSIAIISPARGCTSMPPGQGRTVNFNVGGFTLPSAMAYSTVAGVQSQVPLIAKSEAAAVMLVRDLIMGAVIAVLEENGRNALLPDFVISAILDQLTVNVNYTPLSCPMVYLMAAVQAQGMAMACFIIDNVVTVLCGGNNCNPATNAMVTPIPPQHFSITGNVTTTNFIMAGWSNQMWQSVFSRALQMVRRGPFATNFAGAFVTTT